MEDKEGEKRKLDRTGTIRGTHHHPTRSDGYGEIICVDFLYFIIHYCLSYKPGNCHILCNVPILKPKNLYNCDLEAEFSFPESF